MGKRPTRAQRYLALLRVNRKRARPADARDWPEGLGWISLPEVQREAGAQHGARKQELEALGHDIENRMRRQPDGEQWSWYRLTRDASEPGSTTPAIPAHRPLPTVVTETATLFPANTSRPYRDPEEAW